MRVILITQGISPILEPFLQSQHSVVGIVESALRSYRKVPLLYRFRGFLNGVLSAILSQPKDLRSFARTHEIPYFFLSKDNNSDFGDWLRRKAPHVVVVYRMSQLLTEDILDIPEHGCINLHPAYLPKYRGPVPGFWQYYDMDLCPGITVHHIDPGEDTGDIIFQEKVEIPLGSDHQELRRKLVNRTGPELLLEAVRMLARGNCPAQPQPAESPTRRARLFDLSEVKHLIDWDVWPVERVWHFLKGDFYARKALLASNPVPGIIYTLESYRKTSDNTRPGRIERKNNQYILGTKDGEIILSRHFSIGNFLITMAKKVILVLRWC